MTENNERRSTARTVLVAMMVAIVLVVSLTSPAAAASRTYTLDADFAEGVLNGVNYDDVPDQLQLDSVATTFPVMWLANAGEDTVSKFNTTANKEVGRYCTWFGPGWHSAWEGPAPSRTAVDRDGNVYVANRHFDGKPASVMKILLDGGIDRNGNGVIDTSSDLNGNGIIESGEFFPMIDANGNGMVDPDELADERIAWIVQVGPDDGLGRSLSIDPDGNMWVGLYNSQEYYKISSLDGSILAGPIDVSPNTPYGSLVDRDGILWGSSLGTTLLKLDTNTGTKLAVYDHSAYGMDYGIALGNDKVYLASWAGHSYIEFNPATATFSTPAASKFPALGIAVDADGNIVVGNWYGGVTKFASDGSVIWSSAAQSGTGEVRGIVVDSDNNVWAIHRADDNISKYNGTDGSHLGVFAAGHQPYTYSDATGLGYRTSMTPTGTWTAIYDSGSAGTTWGMVSWADFVPTGASVEVTARAAETEAGLPLATYQTVNNGVGFSATGRYIQMQTRLTANAADESPILYDLTVESSAGGPTVESALISGTPENTFQIGDPVYATVGSGYAASTTYDLYVVDDTTWTDGMAIPSRVGGTESSVTTDASGNIPAGTLIWTSSSVAGNYDIVVDVTGNGQYDTGIDALDSNMDTGFEIIQITRPVGTIVGSMVAIPVVAIIVTVFLVSRRKREE
jgi:hypothetical protein